MSDNATGSTGHTGTGTAPATPPAAPAAESPRSPEEWAAALARTNKESADRRHALKAAEEARAAAEAELSKIKAAQAAAEAEKLRVQGEWQKLAEQEQAKAADLAAKLTAAEAKAGKFEAGLKLRETALVEKIPEAARSKLKLDSLSLEDRVSTLETLAEMLVPAAPPAPAAPNVTAPPVTRTGPAPTSDAKVPAASALLADRSLTPMQRAKKLRETQAG